MERRCKHCGMDSDTERVCSWCGKDLVPAAPARPSGPPPPQAGPPGPAPPPRPGPAERRQPQPVQRGRPAWVFWAIAAAAVVVLGVGGCFVAAAVLSRPPAAAGEARSVESHTKKMTLQVPANWKWTTSGSEGTFEAVKIRPGGLYVISIEGNSVRGSIGDIGAASSRMMAGEGDGSASPVAMKAEGGLHALIGAVEDKEDPNFEETTEMQSYTFGGNPAAYSEYSTLTRVGIATVRLKGGRISAPAGDLGYDVRVICPAAHWDTFSKEAFKVLESVQLQ